MSGIVHRFRLSDRTAASAPVSEPSQRIITGDQEKGDEVHAEVVDPSVSRDSEPIVYQEHEKFEWREVMRGGLYLADFEFADLFNIRYAGIQAFLKSKCGLRDSRTLASLSAFIRIPYFCELLVL